MGTMSTTTTRAPRTIYEAARAAREHGDGTYGSAFYNGMVDGFLAAEMPDRWYAPYRSFIAHHFLAQPVADLGQAIELSNLCGGRNPGGYLRACGMLWGFKEATEPRPDAETCAGCDHRILLDTDEDIHHCTEHGYMHRDCQRNVCRSYCYDDPEFDDDAYYAARYGDPL